VALSGVFWLIPRMDKKQQNLVKIGERIIEIRKLKGLSQEELAARAGMGRTYMGRIERGEQNASIRNMIKIAKVLDVQMGDLFPEINDL